MARMSLKKYIVTYQSQEHYEVLGYVMAESIEDAIKSAKEELKNEAKFYEIEEAEIGEVRDRRKITFDVNQK